MRGGIGIGIQELVVVLGVAVGTLNIAVPGLGNFLIGRAMNGVVSLSKREQSSTTGGRAVPVAHAQSTHVQSIR